MIRSFSAQHFKSFERLRLDNLREINVIVGRSAAGKTTLLEALRVGMSGQPQTLWNLLAQRSLALFMPGPTREQTEALWGQYFYNFDVRTPIEFIFERQNGENAQVTVGLDPEVQVTSTQTLPGILPMLVGSSSLFIERKPFDGQSSTLRGSVSQQGGLQFESGLEIGPVGEFLTANQPLNAQQAANWFSNLSIANRERPIVQAVRDQFSFIQELSVQAPNGISSLHATVERLARKVPLSSVSAGINKFVSILLAIEQFSNGNLMIDEIENGIYYELFEPFWKSLSAVSKESKTQLFITTHSLECLKGLISSIEAEPQRFNLVQVYQENGRSQAVVVPGHDALAAIENGIEVRV